VNYIKKYKDDKKEFNSEELLDMITMSSLSFKTEQGVDGGDGNDNVFHIVSCLKP